MQFVVAQLISISASLLTIFSFQFKKNSTLFIMQGIGALLFAISFAMLNVHTAAVLNLLNVFRGYIFAFSPKNIRTLLMIVLQLMYITATVLTFGGALSVLVMIAQIAGTLAMWSENGKIIRLSQMLVVSPIWLINNILAKSIGGIFSDSFCIISSIVSILRYGINGFETKSKAEN